MTAEPMAPVSSRFAYAEELEEGGQLSSNLRIAELQDDDEYAPSTSGVANGGPAEEDASDEADDSKPRELFITHKVCVDRRPWMVRACVGGFCA